MLSQQVQAARADAIRPVAGTLNQTMRDLLDEPRSFRPNYELGSSIATVEGERPEQIARYLGRG